MRRRDERLYLSAPHVTSLEAERVVEALKSGWVSPNGPEVTGFEHEIASFVGVDYAVALTSGTAALHLGLKYLGVGPGDLIAMPTLTFAATAFAATYLGAEPVFVDVETTSWNMDADALLDLLDACASRGNLPKAIVTVDLFGRPADYTRLLEVAERFELPILEDAAEALGSNWGSKGSGSLGRAGALSFNGNKIMTTSGGGMVVTDDGAMAERIRFWSTQSREQFPWFEHEEIGYNYRLSNILAALGRAQLARLPEMIDRRRGIRDGYASGLKDLPGVHVLGDPPWGRSNGWLTTARFDSALYPQAPSRIRLALEALNIESRHIWKPLHLQPVFSGAIAEVNGTAERLFQDGLCLPSGVVTTDDDITEIVEVITDVLRKDFT